MDKDYQSVDANAVIRQLAGQLADKEVQIAMLKTQVALLQQELQSRQEVEKKPD